eukprot:2619287-Pleurochrysis_carterae.AAC.2
MSLSGHLTPDAVSAFSFVSIGVEPKSPICAVQRAESEAQIRSRQALAHSYRPLHGPWFRPAAFAPPAFVPLPSPPLPFFPPHPLAPSRPFSARRRSGCARPPERQRVQLHREPVL